MAQKKRIRALNADGDVTWCSADVMGTKGCNHLAHGTETEMEAAQIEFFMNEGGLIGNATSTQDAADSSTFLNSSNDAQHLKVFREKQRLSDLLAAKGLTEEHLQFMADPNSGQVLMDADYEAWISAPLSLAGKIELAPEELKPLKGKLFREQVDTIDAFVSLTTSGEALEQFYRKMGPSGHYDGQLLANPHTPADVLRKIADDPLNASLSGELQSWIKSQLASNPNTPSEILEKLSSDLSGDGLSPLGKNQLLIHPNLPAKIKEDFLGGTNNRESDYLKRYIARGEKTTPEDLEKLYKGSGGSFLHGELAANANTPKPILEEIYEASKYLSSINEKLASNPNTPASVLRKLYNDLDARVRREAAKNPSISNVLMRNIFEKEPELVASNPRLPVDFMEEIAESEGTWSRPLSKAKIELAINRSAPLHVLEKLEANGIQEVTARVARNRNSSPELLEKIYGKNTQNYEMMRVLACHPNASPKLLENIGKVKLNEIKEAKRNRYQYVTPTYIDEDARNKFNDIQTAVARHPNSPVETLKQLAKIPDRSKDAPIRKTLIRNKNFPISSIATLAKSKYLQHLALGEIYARAMEAS